MQNSDLTLLDNGFESLLDHFFRAESVFCFSRDSEDLEADSGMEELVAGRLSPAGVEDLFSKLRSNPSAVARLASLLIDSKDGAKQAEN